MIGHFWNSFLNQPPEHIGGVKEHLRKIPFYAHALRRFDKPKEDHQRDNLIVHWADEAQRFVIASEEGMSDYNCVNFHPRSAGDRCCRRTILYIVHPTTGPREGPCFHLNLRNRPMFKAAYEEVARESADFIGKNEGDRKLWGYRGEEMSQNHSGEHRIKPHVLRTMAKHAFGSLSRGTSTKINAVTINENYTWPCT